MTRPERKLLQIGEVARRTGLSAKALRLYQAKGLLRPAALSPAGYRLYGATELASLMQIVLLRNSGFSLAEIAILLREDAQAATRVLRQRIARLEAELGERRRALSRLKAVAERAVEASSLPIAQLLESIAMTTQLKVPFTPAEREAIAARALDPAQLEASQREWRLLIAEVRTAIDAGTAPDHPFAQDLARRWQAQVSAFSGGDATIARKVGQAYRADPNAMAAQGLDMAMFDYIAKALRAAGEKLPEQA